MRLFVALSLPEEVRAGLARLCHGLPGARWVDQDNLHLTVRFLGELDGGAAADVDAALGQVRAPAFDMALSGLGHFGEGRHLRALWVGVEPNPALMHLQERIEQALVRAGIEPDGRKFKAHVTLARFKRNPRERLHHYLAEHNLVRAGPIPVRDFKLYSSFLSSSGALHRVEAAYPLEEPVAAGDYTKGH
jgi:2'-5' RNA ligase